MNVKAMRTSVLKRKKRHLWYFVGVVLTFAVLRFITVQADVETERINEFADKSIDSQNLLIDDDICARYNVATSGKPDVTEPIYFLTAKFRVGNKRWTSDLEKMGCTAKRSGVVDHINVIGDEMPTWLLELREYEKHRAFLSDPEHPTSYGAGYWFWKPLLVLNLLKSIPDGAYVVYVDADQWGFQHFVVPVIEAMKSRNHDFAGWQWKARTETVRTKGDIFHHFHVTDKHRLSQQPQHAANFFVIQKNPTTLKFVQKWADLVADYHLLSDEKSLLQPDYFAETTNRHDQSMFSMLIKFVYNDGGDTKAKISVDTSKLTKSYGNYVSMLNIHSLRLQANQD